MDRLSRFMTESEATLTSIWNFTGVPQTQQVESLTRLCSQVERVVADAVREAERVERRLVLEARAALEAIYRLSSHLHTDISSEGSSQCADSVVGPLAKLYGQGMRLSCTPGGDESRATSIMRHKDWPLTRPLAPEVEEVVKGHSLESLLVSLRQEKHRLEAIADAHIHNLYSLQRYEQLFKLPIQEQRASWVALLASLETVECTGGTTTTAGGSPGSTRKRPRESDAGTPLVDNNALAGEGRVNSSAAMLVASPSSSTLLEKKAMRSLDISSERIRERVRCVAGVVEQEGIIIQQQSEEVIHQIRSAVDLLNSVDGLQRDPEALLSAATKCLSPDISASPSSDASDSLLPEVWNIVSVAPPTARLQRLLLQKQNADSEYHKLIHDRLDEAIVLLAEAYATFHAITGVSSHEAPDYRVWARNSVMGESGGRSKDDEILRLQDATCRAKSELEHLHEKIEFIRDNVVPLWTQRRDILNRKDCLKNMSADRLFNKRGNMARVLLQEENLRKEVSKKLPKLKTRLLDLCQEWRVKFGGSPLQIEGCCVEDVLATEKVDGLPTTSRCASRPRSPPPPLTLGLSGHSSFIGDSKENSPLAAKPHHPCHGYNTSSALLPAAGNTSLPSSRRASPMPRRPVGRSATPSPPPLPAFQSKKC